MPETAPVEREKAREVLNDFRLLVDELGQQGASESAARTKAWASLRERHPPELMRAAKDCAWADGAIEVAVDKAKQEAKRAAAEFYRSRVAELFRHNASMPITCDKCSSTVWPVIDRRSRDEKVTVFDRDGQHHRCRGAR